MKLEHPEKSAEPQRDGNTVGSRETRRKLIQTGLAGAPLLMALKSVPALAADCKQPSGFSASGNLSRNGTTACAGRLNGVSFWTNFANNNTGDSRITALFSTIFTTGPKSGSGLTSTSTIRDALNLGAANIHAKIAAAWLSEAGSFLLAGTVQNMWNLGVGGGSSPSGYHPSASAPSVVWYEAQVVQYLDYVLLP